MIGLGPAGAPARAAPSRRQRLVRWARARRRLAACLLAAAAAGSAVHALAPPAPQVHRVLGAAQDLPAGHVLAPADVRVVPLPPDAVPDGSLPRGAAVAGRVLAGAVRRGEVLTDARVAGAGLLAGARPGLLAVPVAVDGALPPGLVGPGDAVAVLAGASARGGPGQDGPEPGGGEVLVRSARVLLVSREGAGGLLGGSAGGQGATTAVLALDAVQAARVAGASGDRPVTLALVP